ncbi:MAG: hypothetical protein PVI66_02455 [Candidatus Aminicenantes bacterium]|jgi:hypothetical protein
MKHSQPQKTPANYRIKVKGILDQKWSEWFEGMTITYEEDATILEGPVIDQAALHGLLVRIRDLNLTLQYLIRNEPRLEKKNKS